MSRFSSTIHSTQLKTGTALCGALPSGLVAINHHECLSECPDAGAGPQAATAQGSARTYGIRKVRLGTTVLPQKAVNLHFVYYSGLWKCARSRFLIANNLFSATEIAMTTLSLVCFPKETEGKKILPLWKAQCFGQLFMLAGILC